MDEEMQATDAGTIELGHRLDAYARARLSPDPRATARTRARVMRESRLSFEAARIAVHVAPAIAASGRSTRRRLFMPLLAAAVWLSIAVGSIAATQAGGPLYPSRMWVESALLPSGAGARTAADLNHLDERLGEALSGVARGDGDAVAASLDAYFLISADAITESSGDPALEAIVTDALDHHQVVLTAIAGRLADEGNATAVDAIERNIQRAIEHNAAVINAISSHGTPQGGAGAGSGGNGAGGGPGAGGPGAGGAGGAGGGGAGGPGSAGQPQPANPSHPPTGGDKPAKTPKPTPQPTPVPTPAHTPRGPSN
jgi:hypothetical protein